MANEPDSTKTTYEIRIGGNVYSVPAAKDSLEKLNVPAEGFTKLEAKSRELAPGTAPAVSTTTVKTKSESSTLPNGTKEGIENKEPATDDAAEYLSHMNMMKDLAKLYNQNVIKHLSSKQIEDILKETKPYFDQANEDLKRLAQQQISQFTYVPDRSMRQNIISDLVENRVDAILDSMAAAYHVRAGTPGAGERALATAETLKSAVAVSNYALLADTNIRLLETKKAELIKNGALPDSIAVKDIEAQMANSSSTFREKLQSLNLPENMGKAFMSYQTMSQAIGVDASTKQLMWSLQKLYTPDYLNNMFLRQMEDKLSNTVGANNVLEELNKNLDMHLKRYGNALELVKAKEQELLEATDPNKRSTLEEQLKELQRQRDDWKQKFSAIKLKLDEYWGGTLWSDDEKDVLNYIKQGNTEYKVAK